MNARWPGLGPLLLALSCAALTTASPALALPPLSVQYRVSFEGNSTLHRFEGSSEPQTVELAPLAGTTDEAPQFSAQAAVPVAALVTGNGSRDGKMHAMLEAQRFPQIKASFTRIDVAAIRAAIARGDGELPFELTIRDVTRQIVGVVSAWRESADEVSFEVGFGLSLKDFGLQAPSTFGLLRVGDQVKVLVHSVVSPR